MAKFYPPAFIKIAQIIGIDPAALEAALAAQGKSPADLGKLGSLFDKLKGSDLAGAAGEKLGKLLGPDGATKFAETFGVRPDSWFGANLAYGAGDVAAGIPGLQWAPGVDTVAGMSGGLNGQALALANGNPTIAAAIQQGGIGQVPSLANAAAPGLSDAAFGFGAEGLGGGASASAGTGAGAGATTMGISNATLGMAGAGIVAAGLFASSARRKARQERRMKEFLAARNDGTLDTSNARKVGPFTIHGAANGANWVTMDQGTNPNIMQYLNTVDGDARYQKALRLDQKDPLFKFNGDINRWLQPFADEDPSAAYILNSPFEAQHMGRGDYDLTPEQKAYFRDNPVPEDLELVVDNENIILRKPVPGYHGGTYNGLSVQQDGI